MFALPVLLIDFCLAVDVDEVVRLTRVHYLIDSVPTISSSIQPSR